MEAKRFKYNSKMQKSNNHNKIIWEIVKLETGKKTKDENICRLNTGGNLTSKYQETTVIFNKHFLSIAENINTKNRYNDPSINNMPIHYLLKSFKTPFPNNGLYHRTCHDSTELKILQVLKFDGQCFNKL
jgi:hypothetical protein